MKGSEFLRKIRQLAKQRGLHCEFVPGTGKGSHGRLYLGEAYTTLKDRKKEIGPGLLKRMCKQLGINSKDLE